MESLSQMIAIVLSVVLIFIFPVLNMFDHQDDISRIIVFNETTALIDSVRNLGYLTPRMYEDYQRKLKATGNTYVVDLTHLHLVVHPVYENPMDLDTFLNEARNHYDGVYHEEIIKKLSMLELKEGYPFSAGDFIKIKVYNQRQTLGMRLKEMFIGASLPEHTIYVQYGGVIKNESY